MIDRIDGLIKRIDAAIAWFEKITDRPNDAFEQWLENHPRMLNKGQGVSYAAAAVLLWIGSFWSFVPVGFALLLFGFESFVCQVVDTEKPEKRCRALSILFEGMLVLSYFILFAVASMQPEGSATGVARWCFVPLVVLSIWNLAPSGYGLIKGLTQKRAGRLKDDKPQGRRWNIFRPRSSKETTLTPVPTN